MGRTAAASKDQEQEKKEGIEKPYCPGKKARTSSQLL
jgi:hypothetical protein